MAYIHRSKALSLAVLLGLTTALPVLGQEADESALTLDVITVTAGGLPADLLQNPASVSIIDEEDIRKKAPVSAAALLRDVPGVEISEDGIERISIRGESARRTTVMIDGQQLTDHTNYGQPVLIDPSVIERIEVIRGPASVTTGKQAIGGTVNIITKKGADVPFRLTTSGGVIGASDGWRGSATAAGTIDAGAGALEYRLSFGRMRQDNRRTADGVLPRSDTSDRSMSGYLAYRQGNHLTGIDFLGHDVTANMPMDDPEFILELPRRDLRKVSVFHEVTELTPWLNRLRVEAYRQTIKREFHNNITTRDPKDWALYPNSASVTRMDVLSDSTDRQLTWGASIRADMQFSPNSRTIAGLTYEDDRLTADKYSEITTDAPAVFIPSPIARHDKASIRTLAIYGQHEVDVTDRLTLSLGGRWYKAKARQDKALLSMMGSPFTDQELMRNSDSRALFTAGAVWQMDEDTTLRANIAQGYAYPTLGQLFLRTTAGGTPIDGNPDLRPERATNYELGLRRDRDGLLVDATLFHSRAKDYIAIMEGGYADQYENIDRARTWGLELHAEYASNVHDLTPYVTATALRRKFIFANGYSTTDSGTASLSGRVGVRKGWTLGEVSGDLDLFVRAETGVKLRDAEGAITDRSAGFGTLNLHATADLGDNLSAVIELNNLTNRSYQPWQQIRGAGRSVNVFLTRSF